MLLFGISKLTNERNHANAKKNKIIEWINVTETFRIKLLTKMTIQIAMAIVTSGKIDPMI